jgi:hypothetical protein
VIPACLHRRMTSRLILVIGDLFIPDRAPVSISLFPLPPAAQG